MASAAMAMLWIAAVSSLSPARLEAAEKTQTATGVVQGYSAATHAFTVKTDSAEVRLVWTKDTKFNGVVGNGARVTVRYIPQAGGENVAQTVGVLK